MSINSKRRRYITGFLKALPLGVIGPILTAPRHVVAATSEVELVWGGLGFSGSNADLDTRFPLMQQALIDIGGTHVVVKSLVESIESQGKSKVRDLLDTYDSDDGLLVYSVGIDFEQRISVSGSGGQNIRSHFNFVYATALVLYIETNSSGGQDGGRLSVLYGYPFRSQSNMNIADDALRNQYANDILGNIMRTFKKEVADKSFSEKSHPKGIKVASVEFSDDFNSGLDFVSIRDKFNSEFVANQFSTSLAEMGGLSVVPFRSNQLLGKTLAGRFKDSTKVFELASNMGGPDMLDYEINIRMHKLVRKVAGENVGNVRIKRGISAFVSVSAANNGQKIFEKKITQLSDVTLDRTSFANELSGFDLRYFIQMVIKMFDEFVTGVMTSDSNALTSIGLDAKKDKEDLKNLKQVFDSCVYDSRK